MKKILFSVIAILLAVGVVGGGAFALFYDVEEMGQNVITAGTLNLQVGDNDPCTERIELKDIDPRSLTLPQHCAWDITNTGSLPGKLTIEFSDITNNELGRNEPEALVDPTGGWYGNGELGKYLRVHCQWDGNYFMKGEFYYGGYPFLNALGGKTYPASGEAFDTVLEPGETKQFLFGWDLKAGHGGNIIQSDSVEFHITFHLDQ